MADITQLAQQFLGTPYLWGGAKPGGFDCSGLTSYVYNQAGIAIPRTSQEQWNANVGNRFFDMGQAQPGDLVFFEPTSGGPGHVGIYVGNGMMIDAPHTGANVRFDQVQGFGAIVGYKHFNGATGTSMNNPGAAPVAAPPTPSPQDVQKVIQDSYGYMAWALNIPELSSVITQAAQGQWSQGRFQSALQATQWWQTHASTAREWAQLQATDPGTAQRETTQKTADINQLATRLGIQISPERLNQMATDALSLGWNGTELNSAILAESNFGATQKAMQSGQPAAGGNIASIMTQMKGQAAAYMIPLSDQEAYTWAVKELQTGADPTSATNDQGFVAYLQAAAKSRFGPDSPVAAAIDQGIKPTQYFDPQKQAAAKTLEVSPDSIDFMNNPAYGKIIDFVDPSGARRPMTLQEQQTYLRGMPQWQRTQGAQQEMGQMTQGLMQTLGVAR